MLKQKRISIAIVAYEHANAIDVFGPMQVFASANDIVRAKRKPEQDAYSTQLISLADKAIRLSTKTTVMADCALDECQNNAIDTLIVAGGDSASEVAKHAAVIEGLCPLIESSRRVVSVCSGAFILAATGVLEHRKATTHWNRYDEFKASFPNIDLDIDAVFTRDEKFYCSAGVSTGIDLALHLVEEDYGQQVALATARELVMFYHRPGGQKQFSKNERLPWAKSESIINVQLWVEENLHTDISVGLLADKASMSLRTFSRKFSAETGLKPSAFIALVRLNKARSLLEEGNMSIARVAELSGYRNSEILRRLFIRELNVAPTEYRQRFHANLNQERPNEP